MLTLAESLCRRLDFEQATVEECRGTELLPSSTAESVTSANASEYSDLIKGQALAGFSPQRQETAWASKGRNRFRPVGALPVREKILLRVLVNDVSGYSDPFDRSWEQHKTFERSLLGNNRITHIVIADIASFYYYIDHGYVEQQLVDISGRADTASFLKRLLNAAADRQFGLPQGIYPSDWLSEQVLLPLDRRLLRAGIKSSRFADDFRIGCTSWPNALLSLERLAEELSTIGMTLNDEKTRILKVDTYEANLDDIDDRIDQKLAEASVNLSFLDPYSGVILGANEEEVQLHALSELFVETVEERTTVRLGPRDAEVNRRVLQITLPFLARLGGTAPLEHVTTLVNLDPALADRVGPYLRRVASFGNEQDVGRIVDETLGRPNRYVSAWEQAWMIQALINPGVPISRSLASSLERFLHSRSPSCLRARAAIALAARRRISDSELLELYDRVAPVAQPDLVAAMAIRATSSAQLRKLRRSIEGDPLSRLVFNYATEQDWVEWL